MATSQRHPPRLGTLQAGDHTETWEAGFIGILRHYRGAHGLGLLLLPRHWRNHATFLAAGITSHEELFLLL